MGSTQIFLLDIFKNGENERKTFIEKCSQKSLYFEKPIKKQKLISFAHLLQKLRNRIMLNVWFVWEHFIHVVDMAQMVKYHLTPVSLYLSHVNWMMWSTPKSALVITPDEIDVQIIDATFFLHLHKDLSANFGGVAKYLLRSILQRDGKVIHFVSDKWITLSVKDCERQSRNAADISYQITSAGQKRLINWLTALRSSSFKTSLVEFFVSAWSNSDYSLLFEGKILFANCGSICYKFLSILDKAARTKEMSLSYTLTERSR